MPKLPAFECPVDCLSEYWKDANATLWARDTKSEVKVALNRKFKANSDLSSYSEQELKLFHSRAKQKAVNKYNYDRIRNPVEDSDDVANKRPRDDALQEQLDINDALREQLDQRTQELEVMTNSFTKLKRQLVDAPTPPLVTRQEPTPQLARKPVQHDMVFIKPYMRPNFLAQILDVEFDGTYMVTSHEDDIESLPFRIPASDIVCFARLDPPSE
tara:strand:- start:515 stop:1159 length:645 start_codon:yes stop_codon:yes gene_type:complete